MKPLRFGQIIWVSIADGNGIRKVRPAVVVSSDDQITQTNPIQVVAISSRIPDQLPDDHVALPWHPKGHPRTGLKLKCAAVCTWTTTVLMSEIEDIAGIVPGTVLAEIVRKVNELANDDEV
ncbi:MAG: hypothetical protein EXS16_06460 [Gemmataceae bacterium]|nr:hypothetical protein [Gemmataceae bacterium]